MPTLLSGRQARPQLS